MKRRMQLQDLEWIQISLLDSLAQAVSEYVTNTKTSKSHYIQLLNDGTTLLRESQQAKFKEGQLVPAEQEETVKVFGEPIDDIDYEIGTVSTLTSPIIDNLKNQKDIHLYINSVFSTLQHHFIYLSEVPEQRMAKA